MNSIDTEVLAQIWVDDDETDPNGSSGGLERCVIKIDRSDQDEINVAIVADGEQYTHLYIAPNRALRLAQALIFEASKEWRNV